MNTDQFVKALVLAAVLLIAFPAIGVALLQSLVTGMIIGVGVAVALFAFLYHNYNLV
ncbi:MAG TPA: hypothetical protein VJI75_02580 [Candidatus Nanoarchaeia archaeon]|nr:hypothetical protein [Candidatus Nanoarchaeia archaeon]